MLSQGVMLGFGLEKHVDWKSVAAQTAGAVIGKELHSTMAGKLSDRVSFTEQNLDELLNSTLSNLIETGRLQPTQIAAESLGSDAGTVAMGTQTFMANQPQITGANAQYKGVMAQQMQTPTVEGGYQQDLNGYDTNPQDPFTKALALGESYEQASAASIPGQGIHSALGSSAASAHNNTDVTPHLEKAAQAHPSIAQAVAPPKKVQPFSKPSADIHTPLASRSGIADRARTTSNRPVGFFGGNHAPTPYVNPNKNPDAATQSRTDYNLPQNSRHYAEVSAATMERDARHAAVVQHGNVHAGVTQAVTHSIAKSSALRTDITSDMDSFSNRLERWGSETLSVVKTASVSLANAINLIGTAQAAELPKQLHRTISKSSSTTTSQQNKTTEDGGVTLPDFGHTLLGVTGIGTGVAEFSNVRNDMWKGANGKWYEMNWGGNRFTGARQAATDAADVFHAAGRYMFFADVTISAGEFLSQYQNKNYAGMRNTFFNLGIGAVGTFGGEVGFGLGAGYFIIDETVGWNNVGHAMELAQSVDEYNRQITGREIWGGPKW